MLWEKMNVLLRPLKRAGANSSVWRRKQTPIQEQSCALSVWTYPGQWKKTWGLHVRHQSSCHCLGKEAGAGSYQDSGFVSINVSLGCLCSSQTSVNTTILLCQRATSPFDSEPQHIVSFIASLPTTRGTNRAEITRSFCWIIKFLSL